MLGKDIGLTAGDTAWWYDVPRRLRAHAHEEVTGGETVWSEHRARRRACPCSLPEEAGSARQGRFVSFVSSLLQQRAATWHRPLTRKSQADICAERRGAGRMRHATLLRISLRGRGDAGPFVPSSPHRVRTLQDGPTGSLVDIQPPGAGVRARRPLDVTITSPATRLSRSDPFWTRRHLAPTPRVDVLQPMLSRPRRYELVWTGESAQFYTPTDPDGLPSRMLMRVRANEANALLSPYSRRLLYTLRLRAQSITINTHDS